MDDHWEIEFGSIRLRWTISIRASHSYVFRISSHKPHRTGGIAMRVRCFYGISAYLSRVAESRVLDWWIDRKLKRKNKLKNEKKMLFSHSKRRKVFHSIFSPLKRTARLLFIHYYFYAGIRTSLRMVWIFMDNALARCAQTKGMQRAFVYKKYICTFPIDNECRVRIRHCAPVFQQILRSFEIPSSIKSHTLKEDQLTTKARNHYWSIRRRRRRTSKIEYEVKHEICLLEYSGSIGPWLRHGHTHIFMLLFFFPSFSLNARIHLACT